MLAFLLETENIPPDFKRQVQVKAEGNPFYLEELVNSLIESEALAFPFSRGLSSQKAVHYLMSSAKKSLGR